MIHSPIKNAVSEATGESQPKLPRYVVWRLQPLAEPGTWFILLGTLKSLSRSFRWTRTLPVKDASIFGRSLGLQQLVGGPPAMVLDNATRILCAAPRFPQRPSTLHARRHASRIRAMDQQPKFVQRAEARWEMLIPLSIRCRSIILQLPVRYLRLELN